MLTVVGSLCWSQAVAFHDRTQKTWPVCSETEKASLFFSVLAGLFLSFVFNMYINPLVQTFFGGSVTFECFRRVV